MEIPELPLRQQMFAFVSGSILLLIIVELIRRRKMLEQYSAIWFIIGMSAITFIWWWPLVWIITAWIGAGLTTSTILFFGLLASLLIILQLCVKVSEFSHKLKDLVQEIAIVHHELKQVRKRCTDLEDTTRTLQERLDEVRPDEVNAPLPTDHGLSERLTCHPMPPSQE